MFAFLNWLTSVFFYFLLMWDYTFFLIKNKNKNRRQPNTLHVGASWGSSCAMVALVLSWTRLCLALIWSSLDAWIFILCPEHQGGQPSLLWAQGGWGGCLGWLQEGRDGEFFRGTRRGRPRLFPGHCSSEGASFRAYLVSSCHKTLRWRCFAFKTSLELWFSIVAARQNHLGSLGDTGCLDSTLDRGIWVSGLESRTQSAVFCIEAYQVILLQSED